MAVLEAEMFSDGSWVVIGEHIGIEHAIELMKKSDPDATVTGVNRNWVRYEFMTDDEIAENDIEYYGDGGRPTWLRLHEKPTRPDGITKKATVIDVE
jgi:hypothetical protein